MHKSKTIIILLSYMLLQAFALNAQNEFTGLSYDEIHQILDSRREDAKMGTSTNGGFSAFVIHDRESLYITLSDWKQLPEGFKDNCQVIGFAFMCPSDRQLAMICDNKLYSFEEAQEKFGYKLPSKQQVYYLSLFICGQYNNCAEIGDISKELIMPFLMDDLYFWTSESDDYETAYAYKMDAGRRLQYVQKNKNGMLRVIPIISLAE